MLSTQPIYILREALQYLENQRIMAPRYRFLQDIVGRVVTGSATVYGAARTSADAGDGQQLAALLEAGEGMYRISAFKHEPKDFSYKELRQEVARRKFFQPLYEFAQTFLATAGLSNESVKYYASLVQFYTVYKLHRMARARPGLYLLCFAYHRFRQINDNLIEAFIHLLDQYEKQAKLRQRTRSSARSPRRARISSRRPGPEPVRRRLDSRRCAVLRREGESVLPARPARFLAGGRLHAQHRVRQDRLRVVVLRQAVAGFQAKSAASVLRDWIFPVGWRMRRCSKRLLICRDCCVRANRHDRPTHRIFPTIIPKSVQRYLFTAGKQRKALGGRPIRVS